MQTASPSPYTWEDSFPGIYGHTSISYLKQRPGYTEAKQGSRTAAASIVCACLKPPRVQALRRLYPEAVLVPVVSGNQLPQALASALGLEQNGGLVLGRSRSRKELTATERLLDKPVFTGLVQRGRAHILVDDIVTQGGTLAALRRHILARGGTVCAAVALAYSADSERLAPHKDDLLALTGRFDTGALEALLARYGVADHLGELTRPQIRCLSRFQSLKTMEDKLHRSQQGLSRRPATEEARCNAV